jgi:protein involved in polysaccharide export with SLBB domain
MRSAAGIAAAGLVAALAALALTPRASLAQQNWDGLEARVSRDALQERLSLYDRAAESPAYSEVLRAEARDEAALIRQRLEQGDFRPGDRLYVSVEEYPEMTDTFAIGADQQVAIPEVGEVQLRGVLRSEAQQTIESAIARIIREPKVRARAFVRVLIDGAVGSPGYYLLDSDMPVSDLLRQAGGQDPEARLDALRVERAGDQIVSSVQIQQALRTGATVDHLGLRDGDRVFVPGSRSGWLTTARDVVYVVPAVVGLIALLL